MPYINTLILFAGLLAFCLNPVQLFADPEANDDGYDTLEDGDLVVESTFGLLSNDSSDGGSLAAILKTGPENGSIVLGADGAFTYTPDPNFSGIDSFTYSVKSIPSALEFELDRTRSNVDFSATLTAIGASQTRSDSSSLTGSLQVALSPAGQPFDLVHIEGGSIVLADSVELNYRFLFIVTVDVSAEGGDLILNMTTPGPEVRADASGAFSQVGNDFLLVGRATLSSSVDLGVPDGEQSFDAALTDVDLTGTVTESGDTLTINIPLALEGSFDLSGNLIDLDLEGSIVATAPKPSGLESPPAVVTLEVDPTNDAPELKPDSYVATGGAVAGNVLDNDFDIDDDALIAELEVAPVSGEVNLHSDGSFDFVASPGFSGNESFVYSVSNSDGNVSRELFSYGSEWKYLDDGSNQGQEWRTLEYDDSSWSAGRGQLGYGEGDEEVVIGFGSNPNNKHITTYFRREFTLGAPESVNSLVIGLLRDDASAIYLNGAEVYRDQSLSPGANYNTQSTFDVSKDDSQIDIAIPVGSLRSGRNLIAIEVHKSSRLSPNFSFDLNATAIIPPFTGTVSRGSPWKFLDDGSELITDWRAVGFDDTSWSSAPSPLGYGDASVVGNVNFGENPNNKHVTTYFRKSFEFLGSSEVVATKIRVRRDDGVAVYLNGVEIVRDNLADEASSNTFAQAAVEGEEESLFNEYIVDAALLVDGENILSAELHQENSQSEDLIFDAEFLVSIAKIRQFVSIDVSGAGDVDSDEDDWQDATELFFGSSPNDSKSFPRFEVKFNVSKNNQFEVFFPGAKGSVYYLQFSDDLETWTSFEKIIAGQGNTVRENFPISGATRFYRVIQQ